MIIHVDMSRQFYKKTNVGIAWIDINKQKHKGMALSGALIKKLVEETGADHDFSRLYAICIYLLIWEEISNIEKIIICNDEPFAKVKDYLILLLSEKHNQNSPKIISITEYRYELGEKRIKSLADGVASSYRKRALKEKQWDCGKKLNVVKTSFIEIIGLWKHIEKLKNG